MLNSHRISLRITLTYLPVCLLTFINKAFRRAFKSLIGGYMFRTPKKLTMFPILGTDIQIIIDDKHCDKENALGLYTDNRIILRSKYEDETEFIDTFTHECIHALHFTLGCQFDDTLEEILANTTGHMVAQLVAKLCSVGVMSDK